MKKFEIGQQWRCRDGSRAVIVSATLGGNFRVWYEDSNLSSWVLKDGSELYRRAEKDLIEPWVEKRSAEAEVFMYDRLSNMPVPPFVTTIDHHTDYPRYKLIARKKITITEGEGVENA